jgi:hypothetical protein
MITNDVAMENTTQIAKADTNYPMIRHLASRFKLLNRYRLREIVATDTIFSSVRAVRGARCAQVFYGLTSHHMDVNGMESKSQFPINWALDRTELRWMLRGKVLIIFI